MAKKTNPARGKYKTAPVNNPVLATWLSLNKAIQGGGSIHAFEILLKEEKQGRGRKEFIERLARHITRLRRDAELEEMLG